MAEEIIEMGPREDNNPMEIARAISDALDANIPMVRIARAAGISEPNASIYLKLLDFPKSIQDEIESRSISFSAAREIRLQCPKEFWAESVEFAKTHDYPALRQELKRRWGRTP